MPVRTVADWVASGETEESILESFPRITAEMAALAPLWAKAHPAKSRPKKLSEVNPGYALKSTKTIKAEPEKA